MAVTCFISNYQNGRSRFREPACTSGSGSRHEHPASVQDYSSWRQSSGRRMAGMRESSFWVPDRWEIILIDCSSLARGEVCGVHPFFVLSPRSFNVRTFQVIGLSMTTDVLICNDPFADPVGPKSAKEMGLMDYVVSHKLKVFNWRQRGAVPYLKKPLSESFMVKVCRVLHQNI